MKKIIVLSLIVISLISVEIIGRWCGLTNVPLYIASDKFEYISKPNQEVKIYGHRFATNEYSMRSNPIKKSDTTVVLLVGDSILFGGNQIDQDSLASTLLEKRLNKTLGRRIRVLNVSSKSWGPDNAAAYIRQYGTFNADLIILVFSSGDAHDNMSFKPVVGLSDNYPDKDVKWAWEKIGSFGPKIMMNFIFKNDQKRINEELLIAEASEFNSGFSYFDSLSKVNHIPLSIYLHKTTDEIKQRKLNNGGIEIIHFCHQHRIPVLQGAEQPNMYIDNIHFNSTGQRFLAQTLFSFICSRI